MSIRRCVVPPDSDAPVEVDFILRGEPQEEVRRYWQGAFQREPVGAIRGCVVGPDWQPVRNFRVALEFPRTNYDSSTCITALSSLTGAHFTSDDGTFILAGPSDVLPPGKVARVVAYADGYSKGVCERVTIDALDSAPALTLQLGHPKTLSVRVTEDGAAGRPIEGARVSVFDRFPGLLGTSFKWNKVKYPSTRCGTTFTDVQGRARFPGLPVTEGSIVVQKEGYGRRRVEWRGGEGVLGAALHPECTIEGLVRDELGRPEERYNVWLHYCAQGVFDLDNPEHEQFQTVVRRFETWFKPEDAGRFRFDQLPPGNYSLLVSCGYSDEFTLEPGETLTVTYPDDSVADNPDRWLAERVGDPKDEALRRKLIGSWYRDYISERGRRHRSIYSFSEDGRWERWGFAEEYRQVFADGTYTHSGAHSRYETGYFKVQEGCVKIVNDSTGGSLTYTIVDFPDRDTLVLGSGTRTEPPLHRTDELYEVIRGGEALLGGAVPAPASHRALAQPGRTRGSYFDSANRSP
jgi:hypothetical protein